MVRIRSDPESGPMVRVGAHPAQSVGASWGSLLSGVRSARVLVPDPGDLLEPRLQRLLHRLPPAVAVVRIGVVDFDLRRRFDASALALLLDTCRALAADEPRWAGRPLPPSLVAALQRQSRTKTRAPATRPCA